MVDDAKPDVEADAAALAAHADALAVGIEASLGPWVERSVASILEQWRPGSAAAWADAGRRAGEEATAEVGSRLRALLALDVDLQRSGPLAVLREAIRYPTDVLAAAGVPPVERDEFAERAFPADAYGLAPASFADIDPALSELGLVWGAAKAHVVMARRRAEGLR
ncbi:MAG: hypothetical protein JWM47_2737 [Acidimicrobiales bacterium]|nr:hypothetical protein [Acidimicrobiales bacterium]